MSHSKRIKYIFTKTCHMNVFLMRTSVFAYEEFGNLGCMSVLNFMGFQTMIDESTEVEADGNISLLLMSQFLPASYEKATGENGSTKKPLTVT